MLNQSFVVEVLANEHQNDLLKEADANRTARQVKNDQAGLLKRLAARLSELNNPLGQFTDRASFFTDEAVTAGHR